MKRLAWLGVMSGLLVGTSVWAMGPLEGNRSKTTYVLSRVQTEVTTVVTSVSARRAQELLGQLQFDLKSLEEPDGEIILPSGRGTSIMVRLEIQNTQVIILSRLVRRHQPLNLLNGKDLVRTAGVMKRLNETLVERSRSVGHGSES